MATTSSKVLILFLAIILVFGQDNPKCLEDQVTWFFNHVNKNPGALLDKRLQSRVIPLDPYPFNIGLILSLSCHTRQRSSDTNTTEEEATLGRNLGRYYFLTQNFFQKYLVSKRCLLPKVCGDAERREQRISDFLSSSGSTTRHSRTAKNDGWRECKTNAVSLFLMVKCILSTVWSFFITVGSKRDTESSNARRSGREAKQF